MRTIRDRAGRSAYQQKLRVFFCYRGPDGVAQPPPNRPYQTSDFGPGSYVHSKVWVFDDELAIIGSANCNYRGWAYDSEVGAVIFDQLGVRRGESFARRLRMDLWRELFGGSPLSRTLEPEAVRWWDLPHAWKFVRRYDPDADYDRDHQMLSIVDGMLAGGGNLSEIVERSIGDNPRPPFRACDGTGDRR